MKLRQLYLISIAFVTACSVMEENHEDASGTVAMKETTLSVSMDVQDSTKAALDNTGAFTWQAGDKISVLATDNRFYVFDITEGAGSKTASFTGQIPETSDVATVAIYPAIVSDGAENDIVTGTEMKFSLPDEYNYVDDNTNVSMVAKIDRNDKAISFKQIGGVMRFPVTNLPHSAKFVFTARNKRITGDYSLDLSNLGESFISSEDGSESTVSINYSSETDGKPAVFNVPLPVGVYDDFTVNVLDGTGESIFTKEYHSEKNKIERKTLRIMKKLELEEVPVSIENVYPYFADARAVWRPSYNSEAYALYVDDAAPVILKDMAENGNGLFEYDFGGDFNFGSDHSVCIAKVVDGEIVKDSKSEPVTFKTGEMKQVRTNVGPTHFCIEFTNIAGPVSTATSAYHVQVFDSENTGTEPLYSFYTVDMNVKGAGVYAGRQWYGKKNNSASKIPMRLSIGNLQPGKDYYVRMKAVGSASNPVVLGKESGHYWSSSITIYSKTGESKYSHLYKVTTEPAHSAEVNEVLFEGFDDFTLGTDYINSAATLVPAMQSAKGKYLSEVGKKYKEFCERADKKWCVYTAQFNEAPTFAQYGFTTGDMVSSDCSIKGWTYTGNLAPHYGFVRLGQNASASLRTSAIESEYLSDNPVPCKVYLNACPVQYGPEAIYDEIRFDVYRPDGTGGWLIAYVGDTKKLADNRSYWNDDANYANDYSWQQVKDTVMLAKGWKLQITVPEPSSCSNMTASGSIAVDDLKVVAAPNITMKDEHFDRPESSADNTNYFSYGDNFFPISYWWDVPASFASRERYEEVKNAGFNVVLHAGEVDRSFEANKQIAGWCKELGMKYIGQAEGAKEPAVRIQNTKELLNLYPGTYIGDYAYDEPSAPEAAYINNFVSEFQNAMPGCQLYVNLYPSYARASTQFQCSDYATYLDSYLSSGNYKSISVDIYPLKKNGGVRRDYFYNLDIVRAKTLAKKIPFWIITSSAEKPAKKITEPMIRWTVWVNLAFGSKGVAYFTYWNPGGSYSDIDFPISTTGNRTLSYDWVQRMNSDVMNIGIKLMSCHADGVITTTSDFTMYERRLSYGPVRYVESEKGAIAGCFTDAVTGAKKLLVVNELPTTGTNTVTLSVDNTVTSVKVTKINDTSTVTPTDGKIVLSISQCEAALVEF